MAGVLTNDYCPTTIKNFLKHKTYRSISTHDFAASYFGHFKNNKQLIL